MYNFIDALKKPNPEFRIELFFIACLLGVIPALSTNAIVSSLSFIPWLGVGESFGWTGLKITDSPYGRIATFAFLVPFLFAFLAFLYAFAPFKSTRVWLYSLALIPAALLIFWCHGTVGSVMLHDARNIGVAPPEAVTWFDTISPLPTLEPDAPLPDGKEDTLREKATLELKHRISYDRQNNIHNHSYFVASAGLLAAYLLKFGFRRRGLAVILALTFATSLVANLAWSESGTGWFLDSVRPFVNMPPWPAASYVHLGASSALFWSFEWTGQWTMWVLASLYPVASITLLCVVFRFLVRAYLDNLEVLRRSSIWDKLLIALAYWVPFPVVAVLIITGSYFLNDQIEEWTYNPDLSFMDVGEEVPFGLDPRHPPLTPTTKPRLAREDMGILLVGKVDELKIALQSLPSKVDFASVRHHFISKFDETIRPSLEDYSPSFRIDGKCIQISFKKIRFSFSCLARDLKNSILNSLYQIPKNALRNFVIRTVDAAIAKAKIAGQSDAATELVSLKDKFANNLDSWAAKLRQGFDLGWLMLALLSLAGLALLIQSICRAFLTILARVLVPWNAADVHEEKNYFSMTPVSSSSKSKIKSKLADQGVLEFSLQDNEVFHVKHSLDVSNANRNVGVPLQPFSNPIARIVAGKYFLKRLERNNTLPLKITDVGSNRFVAIRLSANDRVAFRWANFVGMTDNAKLEYLLGLKLPMVALGLVRLPTVKGPGLLVLKVSGDATIAKRGTDSDTVAPYRLVAWDLSAWFRVASSSNFFSMYVDDCQIDVLNDDQAIVDIARDGRAMPGLVYQLWNTIRP